ncbi:MAG: DUF2878 domain-containing protein [Pseudomonadota bacterium]
MLIFVNAVMFEIAWLSSVLGGAKGMPWLGPLTAFIALSFHLRQARKPFDELLLVAVCGLIGAGFDSFLVAAGWVTYKAGLFSDFVAPYWIITMWMLFATTLNVSMRWLRGKPKLAAVIGFYGGPASYLAGQALGGIELVNQPAALIALGIGWAVMMPLLIWLSENLDGMPGRRRIWRAETSS